MPKKLRAKKQTALRNSKTPPSKGIATKKKLPGKTQIAIGKKVDKTLETAMFYGFSPVATPRITKEDIVMAKAINENDSNVKSNKCTISLCPEEKIAVLRTYFETNMQTLPHPVALYFKGPIISHPITDENEAKEKHVGLEIIGTTKSIAEAMVIKTACEILHGEGYKELYVNINSVGDKDTMTRFTRELIAYFKKNVNAIHAPCRQSMKQNIFEMFECRHEKCIALCEGAPKSISYLSEQSRVHFKEVLEYLESLDIPFKIHNYLIGNKSFCTQTMFEIRDLNEKNEYSQPLGVGLRYNTLAKKTGMKKDLPGIGISLNFKKLLKESDMVRPSTCTQKPKIYFIQLGFEAKLKSLQVIELLRQAKIPICQSLSKDKLTAQIAQAENMKIPYTIIMGQKETMDNTVIFREMATRSQDTIAIKDLATYIKKKNL